MCILFIGLNCHATYDLIVCANRDEFHHRATAPADFWPPSKQLLAGKDLLAGGTWLGLNQKGQVAALTNIRDPQGQSDNMRSRGDLVVKALTSTTISPDWLRQHSKAYNPFNLVFPHQHQLCCYHSATHQLTTLADGFHAISNGAMDDKWPKMAKGEQALEAYIQQNQTISIDDLLSIMQDESQPTDDQLPETGVSLEWERRLSSIYIRHPEYGTRSTSVILRSRQGHCQFVEVRYDGKGRQLGRQVFQFDKEEDKGVRTEPFDG